MKNSIVQEEKTTCYLTIFTGIPSSLGISYNMSDYVTLLTGSFTDLKKYRLSKKPQGKGFLCEERMTVDPVEYDPLKGHGRKSPTEQVIVWNETKSWFILLRGDGKGGVF